MKRSGLSTLAAYRPAEPMSDKQLGDMAMTYARHADHLGDDSHQIDADAALDIVRALCELRNARRVLAGIAETIEKIGELLPDKEAVKRSA